VPAHFLAVTLNPEMKYKYFENKWEARPDWIENAKSTVEMVWKSEYKPNSSHSNQTILLPVASPRTPSACPPVLNSSPFHQELSQLRDLPDWKKKSEEGLLETTAMSFSDILSVKQKTISLVAHYGIGLTTLRIYGKRA